MRHLARTPSTVLCRLALAIGLLYAPGLLAQERPRERAGAHGAARAAQVASPSTPASSARRAPARGAAPAELAAGACRLGRWAAAVDLMRVVARSERSADDWLCLARAQRHTGEWVAALDSYDELAESGGKSARARSARLLGSAEREELEAQLAWIEIVPTAPLPGGAQLALDGDPLAPSLLGVSFPVAPGKHELALQVDGGVQKFVRLRFERGERRRVHFALPSEDDGELLAGPAQTRARRSASAIWSRRALVAGSVATGGGLGALVLSGLAGPAQKGVFVTGTASLFFGGLSLITGALLRAGSSSPPAAEAVASRTRLQLEPWLGRNVAGVTGKF